MIVLKRNQLFWHSYAGKAIGVLMIVLIIYLAVIMAAGIKNLLWLDRCQAHLDSAKEMIEMEDHQGFQIEINATQECLDDLNHTWHGRIINVLP